MKRRTNSLVYQHLASFKALNVPKSQKSNTKQITVEGSSSSDEDPKTKQMKKRVSRTRSKAMCKSPDVKRAVIAAGSDEIIQMMKKNSVDIRDFKKKDIFWTLFRDEAISRNDRGHLWVKLLNTEEMKKKVNY